MSSVRKFMFDTDFDAPSVNGPAGGEARSAARPAAKAKPTAKEPPAPVEPAPPPPPPAPTFSEAELKAATDKARAEGQKAGETKGRNAAMAEIEQRVAITLQGIADDVVQLQSQFAADRQAILGDASLLALAILKKMLPELSRRGGLAEVEAQLARCLLEQRREPRLVARVSPEFAPLLEPRIAALSATAGFEGRLQVTADDRLGPTDCAVEWADGGMERHAEEIWAEVSGALERCLVLQGIEMPADLPVTPVAKTAEAATENKPAENDAKVTEDNVAESPAKHSTAPDDRWADIGAAEDARSE